MICTGFLLVGGQGRRMGGGKALKLFQQRPLWTYGRDLLRQVCNPVKLLGACPDLGLEETLVEPDPGQGPLGALIYALELSQTCWNLILALDYPCLTRELLEPLLPGQTNSPTSWSPEQKISESSCLSLPLGEWARLPRCQGQVHPLCGYYHKDAVKGLRTSYEQGERSLVKALNRLGPAVAWVDYEDPAPFLNVNRPSDLVRDGCTGCSGPG